MLKLLNKSKIILGYEVHDYKQGDNFYYIKATATLIDGTLLHIRKYLSKDEYNYSYQWQKGNGDLIVRWDNSPHHNKIATFPHHKHIDNKVLPSEEITLEEVIEYLITVCFYISILT